MFSSEMVFLVIVQTKKLWLVYETSQSLLVALVNGFHGCEHLKQSIIIPVTDYIAEPAVIAHLYAVLISSSLLCYSLAGLQVGKSQP